MASSYVPARNVSGMFLLNATLGVLRQGSGLASMHSHGARSSLYTSLFKTVLGAWTLTWM